MSLFSLSRFLIIVAFLCACLVPLTGAFADDWDDCESNDWDRVIRSCTAIINARQEDREGISDAYSHRGKAYWKKGDYDRAIADQTQSIAVDPKQPNAHWYRGLAYKSKGDNDRAIADFTQAISVYSKPSHAYNSRGNAYIKKGDYDRAIADFDQAIALDPSSTLPIKNRDRAYRLKGDSGRAAAAPAPAPTNPTAPPGCPPAWVLPNGGCLNVTTPTPAPAPTIRRAAPAPVPTNTAPPIRRAAPPPPVNLAFPLQSELKRLGCLTGRVDGVWGGGSRAALRRFSNQAKLRLGSEPSQNALDEAKNTDSGYCQPVRVAPKRKKPKGCGSGSVWLEGQCIRRSEVAEFCGPGFERSGSKCVPMKADHELPSSVKKKKRCSAIKFAFTSGNTCACSGGRTFTGSACVKPQQSGGGSGQTCTPGQTRKANNCRFQCECTGLVTCNWVVEVCE